MLMMFFFGAVFALAALMLFLRKSSNPKANRGPDMFPADFFGTIGLILISVTMFTAAFNQELFGDKIGPVQILAIFIFILLPFFGYSWYCSLKTLPDSSNFELVKTVIFVSSISLLGFGVVFHALVTYHIDKFQSYSQSEHKIYNVKENGEYSDAYLKVALDIDSHKIVNGCYVNAGAEVQPGDLVYLRVKDTNVLATLEQDYKTLTELDYELPSGEGRSVELLSFNLDDFTKCLTIEEYEKQERVKLEHKEFDKLNGAEL